jgi:hypothetical protein
MESWIDDLGGARLADLPLLTEHTRARTCRRRRRRPAAGDASPF